MLRLFCCLIGLALLSSPATAGKIHKPPKKASAKALKKFLLASHTIMFQEPYGFHFYKDGRVESCVDEEARRIFCQDSFSGKYEIKGNSVIMHGTREQDCTEETGCEGSRKVRIRWLDVKLGEDMILVGNRGLAVCTGLPGDSGGRAWTCEAGVKKTLLLRRAGASDGVWSEVLSELRGLESFLVIQGKKAKNKREESEFWYREPKKDLAGGIGKAKVDGVFHKLVNALGQTIPLVEPQVWKWETPYDLILLVGKSKAPGADGP